ncbi:MAG: hypothetical protein QG597_2353, partial [Actinomycetota bacterium]|nr:hypothetical protein [Actinomycetota bacterium]
MEATLEPRLVIPGASDTPAVSGTFVVPDYQRGYRWGRYEVRQLLDDLWDHLRRAEQRKELPSPYFLQPIVVLAREDNSWELIDGQQRLTTLFLLTRYIATRLPGANVRYTLTYETRKRQGHDSNRFLESLPAVEPDERHANVDFHHMALACDAIAEWFEERKNASQAAIDLHTALSKWVYVIWYEAPAGTDANSLFTRLNRDRIPLTDSELIKALVLARDGAAAGKPHRREEVAAQWDSFERDLHDPKLWAFLTGTVEERPTHIDFLFETMTQGGERHDRPRYQTFTEVWDRISGAPTHADSKPGAAAFWHDVVERHGLLTGWFHDRGLYHRIGYLVASGDSIRDLVQEAQPRTHSAFRTYLIERTRARLGLTEAGLSLLRYDHGSGREKCGQVLLLMNVETVLGDDGNVVTVLRDDAARGLFPFDSYSRQGWSLEHIHAQKAQQLRREPERRDWLRAYAGTITAQWPG